MVVTNARDDFVFHDFLANILLYCMDNDPGGCLLVAVLGWQDISWSQVTCPDRNSICCPSLALESLEMSYHVMPGSSSVHHMEVS